MKIYLDENDIFKLIRKEYPNAGEITINLSEKDGKGHLDIYIEIPAQKL